MLRRRNHDRRNHAGGLGEGMRTVRKGGWFKFGDDLFYSPALEQHAGRRVHVNDLSDAFSPETASVMIDGQSAWIEVRNIYHLTCRNQLPAHLEFLRARQGKLVKM